MMRDNVRKESFSWVKRIETALKDTSAIKPGMPTVDWEEISELISNRFDTKVQITAKDPVFRSTEEFEDGFSDSLVSSSFSLTPISGHVQWIMDKEEMAKLTRWMLRYSSTAKGFSSFALQEGFYHYLLLETLDILGEVPLFQNYSPKLSTENGWDKIGAVCMDVSIRMERSSSWGRLVIPSEFLHAFKEQFKGDLPSSPLSKSAEIFLGLNIGKTVLDTNQFQKISKGDFILLDSFHYDCESKEGRGVMSLEHIPLFQVKITPSQIELVDQAFTQEESMEDNEEMNPSEEERTPPPESDHVETVDEESLSIKKAPILLTIELARLKVPLEKLLRFEPGLFLELPTHPEQGVNLTINGKKVGRGELVSLGESVGVRIVEI